MKKNKIILLIIILLSFGALAFYQPIEPNKIYQRKIKLPEISDMYEDSVSNSKMIRQAKNTLENVFSINIDEDNYNISVEYESSQISDRTTAYGQENLTFANISFKDKVSNEIVYMVDCDTSNGEILMLTQRYISQNGSSYMLIDELQEITKSFFEKITHLTQDQILYIDDGIQGNTYSSRITVKNTYETFIIYLDAFDGTVFYYWKTS